MLSDEFANLAEVSKKFKAEYAGAEPFPNIYFDNFFDQDFLNSVLEEFPDLAKGKSMRFDNQNERKYAGLGEGSFGPSTKRLMWFLNSEKFLSFLKELTSIEEKLFGDPYYEGGGQHEIKQNGVLKLHADFNKNKASGLDRRLNLLIYLNHEWREEYGGHFQLWDKERKNCVKKILPVFNRVALFSTTDFSYHGHPDPLTCPEDRSRKSLALYYYSNGRPASEVNKGLEDHSTLFVGRKGVRGDAELNTKSIKYLAKEFCPPVFWRGMSRILKGDDE